MRQYLYDKIPLSDRREAAYRLFCETPMQVSPEQFRLVLQEDPWNL